MADLVAFIALNYPGLRRNLRIAHVSKTPEQFVKRGLLLSLYITLGLDTLFFFLFSRSLDISTFLVIVSILTVVGLFFVFNFIMNTPLGLIRRRQRLMDREALFAGRFLLVKLESGEPLFNSLIAASKSFGMSSKYFKEIVDDISTGTTLEKALERAREDSPSDRYKKILWQIISSLKTGTEVGDALRRTLHNITNTQVLEIKEYGKKLNSLMLFYMVLATVVPSLGITLFLIISSFVNLQVSAAHLFFFLFVIATVQFSFVALIRTIRPMVDV